MNLELLKLIIDPTFSNQTCFLCFKHHEELNDIHSEMVIVKDHQEFTVTIFKMVSYLISLKDIFTRGLCDKCSNIVLSFYIMIQKHNAMKQNLMKLSQKLEKAVTNVTEYDKVCYLRINDSNINHHLSVNKMPASKSENLSVEIQECHKCDMNFESKDQLLEHKKIVHKNTNEAVVCHICGKSCKTPSSLKGHLNCHKEKQCPYCSKFLKTHSHYKIHVQNHVSSIKRKRNHTSYNCHNCSFVSLSKGSLEAHINKAHLGLRPHVCPTCQKGFFKKSNLSEHIKIHSKVKTETCEVCGDSFVNKKTLMEHLRLHENQKPFKCDICFKTFVTSGRRSDHVKRTHMEKSECCLICNKMFSLKKELNRHVKKSHGHCHVPELIQNIDNSSNMEMLTAPATFH